MYTRVLNFIKYNNAFTILLVLFFLGFGISFAAEPAVRDSILSSQETVISVDNSYLLSTDLNSYNFDLKISSITEDEKNYYATYSYQTIQIIDSVWQNKQIEKTLTVSKEVLEGKDLGLYLAKQLGENITFELSYLQKVQQQEKEKGESQKIITTEYSGLIGKLLDTKQEVIEGYNPVIPEIVPEVPVTVEENPQEVIVSTQYPEPPAEVALPQTTLSTTGEQTPSNTEGQTETTPVPSQEEVITPESTPTVNEELVQEVVEVLLENKEPEPTVTEPVPSNTSGLAPSNIGGQVPTDSSEPITVPQTPTPESNPQPIPESTP